MIKVFPVKRLDAARFSFPASQCFSIIKERIFKERFFTFKADERLLKDNDSFCAGTETGHSFAETGFPAAHSVV